MISLHLKARGALCVLAVALGLAACDKDPSAADDTPLVASVGATSSNDTIIGLQEPIRVVFSDSVDARTALDPENFIVIDRCTGLRVPGALRLTGGDTVVFTPSSALPYLTPLDVRIQNVLDTQGRSMTAPFTFSLITETPAVSDVSWDLLDSPTNDFVSGLSFLNENVGYMSTIGGAIYRTVNGGQNFAAIFKDPDLLITFGIRATGGDTLYMVAAPSFGGTTFLTYGLFRSTDAGRSFQSVFTDSPVDMNWPSVYHPANGQPIVVIGGNRGTLSAWRYDANTDSTYRFYSGQNQTGYRAAISKDGTHAIMTGEDYSIASAQVAGALYRSTTGGRSWVPVTLPAGTFSLFGGGFRNGTEAIVTGARSGVYRFNAATGTITRLTNGLPQTDSTATSLTVYDFFSAEFTPSP